MDFEIIEERLMKSIRQSIDGRELVDFFKFGRGSLSIKYIAYPCGLTICFPSSKYPHMFMGGNVFFLNSQVIFKNKIERFWRNGWIS